MPIGLHGCIICNANRHQTLMNAMQCTWGSYINTCTSVLFSFSSFHQKYVDKLIINCRPLNVGLVNAWLWVMVIFIQWWIQDLWKGGQSDSEQTMLFRLVNSVYLCRWVTVPWPGNVYGWVHIDNCVWSMTARGCGVILPHPKFLAFWGHIWDILHLYNVPCLSYVHTQALLQPHSKECVIAIL